MTVKKSVVDLIAALRSGEYLKGTGALRVRNGLDQPFQYCCEGVMCEISEAPIVKESGTFNNKYLTTRFSKTPVIDLNPDMYTPYSDAFAPSYVWEGSGMTTTDDGEVAVIELPYYGAEYNYDTESYDMVPGGWQLQSLASLNDYQSRSKEPEVKAKNEFTFAQIADLLEWAIVRDYGNK